MTKPDYFSPRENLAALRRELARAYDRGDEATLLALSRRIDEIQLQHWARSKPAAVKTGSAAARPAAWA